MVRQRIDLEHVIACAVTLVDHEGLDELILARVADELGVQASALYNHVEGLEGLRRAVASQSRENLAGALRDAAVGRAGDAALREVARAYRDFARSHPGQYASTLLPASGPTDPAHAAIAGVLTRILETYGLVGDRLVHTARVVRSAVHGFVTLEAADSFTNPQDSDETFDQLLDFIVRGLFTTPRELTA